MTETVAPADGVDWNPCRWLGDLNVFLVSTSVHLVAFVAIGLISLTSPGGFERGDLVVELGSGNDAIFGDEGRLAGGPDATADTVETDTATTTQTQNPLSSQAVASTNLDSVASQLAPASLAEGGDSCRLERDQNRRRDRRNGD
jgi:hypothetical protein